ncbi:GntR family transcriptional regulator [Clostridium sporogenes]|uniref:GntR family transcriptional regulator n=2 Tax=Clostridium TaxID=1485 RepID=A0A7X5P6F1_CLOSG|nr:MULTISPECIES: GntR family transcriptional regulator [Clostridium]AJD32627.1 UTRA domain protein [Clostridium botulinum Prevot_594]AVP60025.1 GntR family transcriptional regulator [Clostridium botulinum]AKC63632.1 GntR family transcriptional regulator [Clostridium sporogenes]AVP65119.1 GntR family transcriptional regulator [Clostridium botulinum]EHN14360.1 GntR family transcriptional regulator [Clostridium sporogenes PA 3679]
MMKIVSKKNPVPLHFQIKEILQEMIENEELKPGDAVPTERELCEIQGVSRMTVNKAIMSLVNEGLLYREQGKGTFVAKPKENKEIAGLKSFSEVMQDKGLKTETRILFFQIKEATKRIKSVLNLSDDNNKVFEISRLRMSEGEPVAIETVWIPYNLCSDMDRQTIEGKSLYETFKNKYKYFPNKAKQTIEPIILNEDECRLLNQNENALALMFRRTTYIKDEVPIEYTKAIYRSDIYKYELVFQ